MKNYLFKPKVINLTLSHNQEKDVDIKYHSETKIQKEIYKNYFIYLLYVLSFSLLPRPVVLRWISSKNMI